MVNLSRVGWSTGDWHRLSAPKKAASNWLTTQLLRLSLSVSQLKLVQVRCKNYRKYGVQFKIYNYVKGLVLVKAKEHFMAKDPQLKTKHRAWQGLEFLSMDYLTSPPKWIKLVDTRYWFILVNKVVNSG